jgi:hypothetical protein
LNIAHFESIITLFVMAALVAAIHELIRRLVFMDGRDKPGHDV